MADTYDSIAAEIEQMPPEEVQALYAELPPDKVQKLNEARARLKYQTKQGNQPPASPEVDSYDSLAAELSKLSPEEVKKLYSELPPDTAQKLREAQQRLAPKPSESTPGFWESLGRGGLQGLTFKASDELGGAVQAGLQGLSNVFGTAPKQADIATALSPEALERARRHGLFPKDPSAPITNPAEVYVKARDEERRKNEQAQAAHPIAYGGAEFGGNVASSLALGGLGVPVASTRAAAGLGALQGIMGSDDALEDSLDDAAVGALLSAGGNELGKYALGTGSAAGRKAGELLDEQVRAPARESLKKAEVKAEDAATKEILRRNLKDRGAVDKQRKQLLKEALELKRKGSPVDRNSITQKLAKLEAEQKTLEASQKGAMLREQLRDQQAEHLYGDAIKLEDLTPEQLLRKESIRKSLPETAKRHYDEPPPAQRAEQKYAAKRDLLLRRQNQLAEEARKPPPTEDELLAAYRRKLEQVEEARGLADRMAKAQGLKDVPEMSEEQARELVRKKLAEDPNFLGGELRMPQTARQIRDAQADPRLTLPDAEAAKLLPTTNTGKAADFEALRELLKARGGIKGRVGGTALDFVTPKSPAAQYEKLMSKARRVEKLDQFLGLPESGGAVGRELTPLGSAGASKSYDYITKLLESLFSEDEKEKR